VVEDVITQALNAERHLSRFARKRARRPADLAVFRGTVEALVAHVAYEARRGAGPIRVSLNRADLARKSRYHSELQSKQLPTIVRLLSTPDLAFLNMTEGTAPTPFSPGRQTRINAGTRLLSRISGVELDDIDRKPGEEVVLLKGPKETREVTADLIEYDDTEITEGYRAEVRRLNAFLKAADIQYMDDTPAVDERNRHMKRRFTRGTFGCGGRLWGGFWQTLTKADRLANVRINDESVVSVDFVAMVASLAYAYVGKPAPAGDLYAIPFTSTSGSPIVLPRGIVKKIFAARVNGAKEWPEELRTYRAGLPWARVVASLKAAHPPLAELLDRDMGQELAFTESEILMEALLTLMRKEVVALPVHDCIVVAESDLEAAREALIDSFKFHTRQAARVSVERAEETA